MNIETLRAMRSSSVLKINNEIKKVNSFASDDDAKFWKLEPDKVGNATATIRFLPATVKTIDGQEVSDHLPWVEIYSHSFRGENGSWFIEKCPTTLGQTCPVCELNRELWNSGSDEDKEIVRKSQKRRLKYYANVLIISDPKHPENEGQVKVFKFGAKIFQKIIDKIQPVFEDEKPVIVFDFWNGADFKVRQTKVEGYPNFDQSYFQDSSSIGSDEEIMKIAEQQTLLKDFLDPKNFKSPEDIQKRLNLVFGKKDTSKPVVKTPVKIDPIAQAEAQAPSSEEDDLEYNKAMEYFRQLEMTE